MSEKKREPAHEVCLQSLIFRRKALTLISLLFVISALVLQFLLYNPTDYQTVPEESVNDLLNFGLQRQLFWGVVALSSFIGYFQFLVVVNRRKSFSWLFKSIFLGFVFLQTISIARVANSMRWVALLEKSHGIPVESRFLLDFIPRWFSLFVSIICFILWLFYLCLFVERMTCDSTDEI